MPVTFHLPADAGLGIPRVPARGAYLGTRSADATAIGILGQYRYVNTRTDTVIVKMSSHGVEQDERETFRAMRAIANSWAQ